MNKKEAEKSLIFSAFAYDDRARGGANIFADDKVGVYLKNAVVALASAKKFNPESDVFFVTNISVPQPYRGLFERAGVDIVVEPFDLFRFEDEYSWNLAFYKLCATEKMLERDYLRFLLIDTDVYVQSNVADLWAETADWLMLYDYGHRLNTENCRALYEETKRFAEREIPLTNYGGEFIAGSRELLLQFMEICRRVFEEMREKRFFTQFGDEFILAIAAYEMREKIRNACAYVCRYWTGSFYLVSTNYRFNPVSILHVPAEKERGMLKLYRRYAKCGGFPKNATVHGILHLKRQSPSRKFAAWLADRKK